MEGQEITDGILAVHEMVHTLASSGMLGMINKLDLPKSYDRLN